MFNACLIGGVRTQYLIDSGYGWVIKLSEVAGAITIVTVAIIAIGIAVYLLAVLCHEICWELHDHFPHEWEREESDNDKCNE